MFFMVDIVLLHGSWHGAWCWKQVETGLRKRGHDVWVPTLTGCGYKHHTATENTGLSTHIEEICAYLHFQDLSEALLIGHSYAGMLVSGVIEKAMERVEGAIYLDAFLPENNESVFDIRPDIEAIFQDLRTTSEQTWLVSPPDSSQFGIQDPNRTTWTNNRLTPMPLRTHTEPISLEQEGEAKVHQAYIQCTRNRDLGFGKSLNRAKERGMVIRLLDSGHDPMIITPKATIECIEGVIEEFT